MIVFVDEKKKRGNLAVEGKSLVTELETTSEGGVRVIEGYIDLRIIRLVRERKSLAECKENRTSH